MSVTLKPHTKNKTFIIEQSDTQNFSFTVYKQKLVDHVVWKRNQRKSKPTKEQNYNCYQKIDKNTLNLYKSQVQHYPLIIYNNQ